MTTASPATSTTPFPDRSSAAPNRTSMDSDTRLSASSYPTSSAPTRPATRMSRFPPRGPWLGIEPRRQPYAATAVSSDSIYLVYPNSIRELIPSLGTVWGQGGGASATGGTKDLVSVIVLSNSPKTITVSIGGSSQTVSASSSVGKAYFYQVPFNGRTGAVTVTVDGKSSTGPQIQNACPPTGHVSHPDA